MDGPQAIIALIFVALVMVGGALAVNYSAEETAPEFDVNESTTTDGINSTASFSNSSIVNAYYSDTATVTNASSGTILTNETDYRWYNSNGTIKILSQNAANTTVYAEYVFQDPTQEQRTVTRGLAFLTNAGSFIPLILLIGLLAIVLSIFGGLA